MVNLGDEIGRVDKLRDREAGSLDSIVRGYLADLPRSSLAIHYM